MLTRMFKVKTLIKNCEIKKDNSKNNCLIEDLDVLRLEKYCTNKRSKIQRQKFNFSFLCKLVEEKESNLRRKFNKDNFVPASAGQGFKY